MSDLWVTTLGEVPYVDAVALQQRLRDARQADTIPDTLLLLEHPPVYTRGRRAQAADLPRGEQWYRDHGIDVTDSDRGGQVTYHGPGQLVGYPIVRVDSVRDYVAALERAMIAALRDEGVAATAPDGLTGVWTGGAKIGSIGVHVSRGVTTHGFSVNVTNDLDPFHWVAACGVENAQVTYHGPGQLVGYPIMRVASVREYVATLERAMIAALRDEGVAATAPEGLTGVWTGDAKIGSIGVHVSRGVTTHGFAVNVTNDLEPFGWIAACGVENAQVTSLAREKEVAGQGSASMSCFRKRVAFQLAQALGLRQRLVTPGRLLGATAPAIALAS